MQANTFAIPITDDQQSHIIRSFVVDTLPEEYEITYQKLVKNMSPSQALVQIVLLYQLRQYGFNGESDSL